MYPDHDENYAAQGEEVGYRHVKRAEEVGLSFVIRHSTLIPKKVECVNVDTGMSADIEPHTLVMATTFEDGLMVIGGAGGQLGNRPFTSFPNIDFHNEQELFEALQNLENT